MGTGHEVECRGFKCKSSQMNLGWGPRRALECKDFCAVITARCALGVCVEFHLRYDEAGLEAGLESGYRVRKLISRLWEQTSSHFTVPEHVSSLLLFGSWSYIDGCLAGQLTLSVLANHLSTHPPAEPLLTAAGFKTMNAD